MTVSAHSQTTNKLVNEAANDSARVSGQDRKIPPALGTNQIAGFGGFRRTQGWKKIIKSYWMRLSRIFCSARRVLSTKAEVGNTIRDPPKSSYSTKAGFNNFYIIHSK